MPLPPQTKPLYCFSDTSLHASHQSLLIIGNNHEESAWLPQHAANNAPSPAGESRTKPSLLFVQSIRKGSSNKRLGFDLSIPTDARKASTDSDKASSQRKQFAELKLEKFFHSQEGKVIEAPSGSMQLSIKDE